MITTVNKLIFLLLLSSIVGFSSCKQKGSMEKAGEKVDDAIDNIKDGESPFKERGAAEKAGEAIDHAIKTVTPK